MKLVDDQSGINEHLIHKFWTEKDCLSVYFNKLDFLKDSKSFDQEKLLATPYVPYFHMMALA